MFDNKFLITLLGLGVVIAAISNTKSKDEDVHEGFLGNLPSMTWKVDQVAAPSRAAARQGNFTSLPQNSNLNHRPPTSTGIEAASKGEFFTVPGTYQSSLAPRFSNLNYGGNIKYNMPSTQNQAVPCNPLTFSSMAGGSKENFVSRENYCGSCGEGSSVPTCGAGGQPSAYKGGAPIVEANYAAGNYNQVLDKLYNDKAFPQATSTLPVDTMSSASADGSPAPVVYDRFIFANRNSRL